MSPTETMQVISLKFLRKLPRIKVCKIFLSKFGETESLKVFAGRPRFKIKIAQLKANLTCFDACLDIHQANSMSSKKNLTA